MRKQPAAAVVLLGALALFAGEVRAQDQMPSPKSQTTPKGGADRTEREDAPGAQAPELRDETFRLMDAYLISNLQESLGLSDEQFVKALPFCSLVADGEYTRTEHDIAFLKQTIFYHIWGLPQNREF